MDSVHAFIYFGPALGEGGRCKGSVLRGWEERVGEAMQCFCFAPPARVYINREKAGRSGEEFCPISQKSNEVPSHDETSLN